MNERIRELGREATIWCVSQPNQDDFDSMWEEKFAELIVKECANHCDLLLDHKISSEWSRGTHDCSKAIKQHFGVKDD